MRLQCDVRPPLSLPVGITQERNPIRDAPVRMVVDRKQPWSSGSLTLRDDAELEGSVLDIVFAPRLNVTFAHRMITLGVLPHEVVLDRIEADFAQRPRSLTLKQQTLVIDHGFEAFDQVFLRRSGSFLSE